jgi:hypothetical protein
MRARVWQAVAFAAVVPALCAADPPGGNGNKRDELHAELLQAIKRANSAPVAPAPSGPTMPPAVSPAPKPALPELPLDGTPASVLKAGVNAFKDGKFEAARLIFSGLDTAGFPREDRAFVKYMIACCLRRSDRIAEAEIQFREVANSDDDEFHKNCAIWQLSLIKSNRELQTQLGELRSRAKTK